MPPSPEAVPAGPAKSPQRPGPLGLTKTQWWITGGVFVAVILYMLYRRGKQAQQGQANAQPSPGECTDANGNVVPCAEAQGIDYSGQLSAMQTELESLLAAESIEPAPVPGPPGPTGPTGPKGNPGGTSAPPQVNRYNAPRNVTLAKLSPSSIRVSWSLAGQPSPPPASYTIAVNQLNGRLVYQQTTNVPDQTGGTSSATVNGLHSGWCYNVRVWANGGKVAPPNTTKKICV